MRTLVAGLMVLAGLSTPTAASAGTVGTATTSTGQTLTVSIDSPADGVTEYGSKTANFSGHVSLSAPASGTTGATVTRIAVGTGDAYEAAGSTYVNDADYYGYDTWTDLGRIAYEGTGYFYATAIADDGTRATANITITVDPRQVVRVRAAGLLYDNGIGPAPPALRATIFDRGPVYGLPIDFYVKGDKVCSSSIGAWGYWAQCDDPTAVGKALAAGGYEARYPGSAWVYPASDTAGLTE